MRTFFAEFKQFAMRGNVVDMAVGIIIGGAFGKIVSSLVNDVVMPPFGVLAGGIDFRDLALTIRQGADGTEDVTLNYGLFINTTIDFLIVAFAVFLLIRVMNNLKRREAAPAPVPTTKECPECRMTIPIAATRCGYCTSPLRP
jgi:large conductance mechanosensitive channel